MTAPSFLSSCPPQQSALCQDPDLRVQWVRRRAPAANGPCWETGAGGRSFLTLGFLICGRGQRQLSGRREDGTGQRQQRASCSARRSAKAPALLPLKPSAFSPRACGQQHPESPRGGNEVTQGQAPGGNSGGNSVASAAIRITMQRRSLTGGRRGPGTRRKRLAPKAALSAALPEPLRTLLRSCRSTHETPREPGPGGSLFFSWFLSLPVSITQFLPRLPVCRLYQPHCFHQIGNS